MKFRKRLLIYFPFALFGLLYIGLALVYALRDDQVNVLDTLSIKPIKIVIFGASGTAGNGILKAALESPDIESIQVITRRSTPRIDDGVASGKVQMTLHNNYLDYSLLENQMKGVDAVYWAIGTSSIGVNEKIYGQIHVDFPARFVENWLLVSEKNEISFHYISSSDISEDSNAMWVREKIRAEKTLFRLADSTKLRVIAYRPDYIGPTNDDANLGQQILYGFFAPVGAAVKAEQIGSAMIEVTFRSTEFTNRDKLNTRKINLYGETNHLRYSHARD